MAADPPQCENRICVVMPTFNNAATVEAVVRGVLAVVPDVIVVDDGSTDGASEALERIDGITLVRHPANLGKGAAILTGLTEACQRGFTHAVTMDADGQHLPSDLPAFVQAVQADPDALVIGVRGLAGGGRRLKSRLLRAHSNFWVWVLTGRWVPDTQSGFRAYPLRAIQQLVLRSSKYDLEVEVLVKAMWAGTPVSAIPVTVEYGPGSRSHFRALRDFALVAHVNGCLFAQRLLLPKSVRRVLHLKSFRSKPFRDRLAGLTRDAMLAGQLSPRGLAAGVGLGVFLGILPIWGFQIATAVVLAHRLRMSKPVVVAASNISFPATIPLILYASLMIGMFVRTGRLDCSLRLHEVTPQNIWHYLLEYLVGSVILAVTAGCAAAAGTYALARALRRIGLSK